MEVQAGCEKVGSVQLCFEKVEGLAIRVSDRRRVGYLVGVDLRLGVIC